MDPTTTEPALATLALGAALHPGTLQASSTCLPQSLTGWIDPSRPAPWPTTTAARLVEVLYPQIGVELSEPGFTDLSPEQATLAVQALVWTVTSVLQRPDAPVVVTVKSGKNIFPGLPGGVFKRALGDRLVGELAPVWVDAPTSRDQLQAGSAVAVSRTACTADGTVGWELHRGGVVVGRGVVTAGTTSCPQERSPWSVPLGVLEAGGYELRVNPSQNPTDGAYQMVVPFTVE